MTPCWWWLRLPSLALLCAAAAVRAGWSKNRAAGSCMRAMNHNLHAWELGWVFIAQLQAWELGTASVKADHQTAYRGAQRGRSTVETP